MINKLLNLENSHARLLLTVHFIISSIGLLGFISYFSTVLIQTFVWPIGFFISYTDWAILSTSPSKPIELLQYALSVVGMIFYYGFISIFINKYYSTIEIKIQGWINTKSNETKLKIRLLLYLYFGLLITLNIWLLQPHGEFTNIIFGFYFLILILPTSLLTTSNILDLLNNRSRMLDVTILFTIIITLLVCFYPYINNQFSVSNDYMDIPEQTIMSGSDHIVVDNHSYIQQHDIGGLLKHDPRMNQDDISKFYYINLTKEDFYIKFAANNPLKYNYDVNQEKLVVKGIMSSEDYDSLIRATLNAENNLNITNFYFDNIERKKLKKAYTPEEIYFIKVNRKEFLDQSLAGHYFHHQNTMLGTINEYNLGKPMKDTVYLYGWLSTVVITEAMKALGAVDFERYQTVFYSCYPLYYLLLLAAAALIFKRISYVVLIGSIAVSTLYFMGIEVIRFAPGFNPIRHFFDIFTLVSLYQYVFLPRRNKFYLIFAFVFSIMGILFSKEFGLVLILSLIATLIVRAILEKTKDYFEIITIIVAMIVGLTSLIMITTGKNPTLLYVLLGVATPAMHWIKLYSLLILFNAINVFLIKTRKRSNNWCYLTLFWLFYTQGVLIYYIWNPAPNHILSLGTIWGVLFALLIKQGVVSYKLTGYFENKLLVAFNSLIALFILLPSIGTYSLEQADYQAVFKTHKIHHWDLQKAKFKSTMEPGTFENSIQLINKYSNSNSIYILSKYDNILPFLSNKYSAMPFSEMALSLVTNKEMNQSVDLIRNVRPEFLFVDTDIARSHIGDIFEENDPVSEYGAPVFDASLGRAMVLDNFGKVFKRVKDLYVPVERGQLITVYKLGTTS